MKKLWLCLMLGCALVGVGRAQAPDVKVIQRLDPALDGIVSPAAGLELLKGDYFGFVEGPLWVPDGPGGYLLFSDIAANRIYKWSAAGGLTVFLERSGFTGRDPSTAGLELNNGRLQVVLLGSNGLTLDREGRVVFCTHGDRAVKRLEKDGTITILADRYQGKRFSGPNDLIYRSDGALYFSDLSAGLRGGPNSPVRELDFFGVYLLKNGQLQVVDKNPEGAAPNGLALSPDEKHLYGAAGSKLARYDVQPDGTLTNRQVFVDMSPAGPGGPDGIKVDRNGNVYSTGPGGVWIISPQGAHLGTIPVNAANFAFGDADGKSLYLTARRDLYRLRVNVAGIHPVPQGR